MQGLALAVGLVVVDKAVRFEEVVVAHDAGECAARHGIVVEEPEFGDSREEVVAGVALGLVDVVELCEHLIVVFAGQVGPHGDVAVADECPHLVVGEPNRVHGVPPSVG